MRLDYAVRLDYADIMKPFLPLFIAVTTAAVLAGGSAAFAEATSHPPTKEEKDFYASTVVPALNAVRKAMPPAPAGWVVAGETKISPDPSGLAPADVAVFHVAYLITYKRVTGIKEELRRLDDRYAESSGRNQEDAKPRIDELIRQQTETSLALRKATRRKNQKDMDRLNDELDENGRKMRAVHEDVDKKIALDVEPYLVKDAEAVVLVSLNDAIAELPQGEPLAFPKAAHALRREGTRAGITSWREGQTMILFGGWRLEREGRFRVQADPQPFSPKVRAVRIVVTGDRKRSDSLIGSIDLRALLDLMK